MRASETRMPNRLYLGPDGRFQSAVPRLTHVHTRAHTLAGPRLALAHTRRAPTHTCAHARAHAGPCPGCVQTPGALCAWLRQSVVSCPHPASRIPAKDLRHVALAHPAPRLLPAWGGTAAPLRPLRPAPPGRAGRALQAQPPGPSSPGPGLPISARAFPRASRAPAAPPVGFRSPVVLPVLTSCF